MQILIILSLFSQLLRGPAPLQSNPDSHTQWDEWRLRTSDGVSLFVREFGTGDTVVVLHGGWGAEHSYLIEVLEPFADRYHFILYDQRGSLRSSCADSLISVENHVEDLERLRLATGQSNMILVAHSMGGFLAMSYQQKYPANVRGLILISSAPAKGTVRSLTEGIQEPAMKRWERPEVTDTLSSYGLRLSDWNSYRGRKAGLMHRITFAALNLHSLRHWRSIQGEFDWNERAAATAATTGPQEWDFTFSLAKSSIPIVLIHGDDDYLPVEYQKQWIGNVPTASMNIIPNAGHLCWLDQPITFGSIFLSALQACRNK